MLAKIISNLVDAGKALYNERIKSLFDDEDENPYPNDFTNKVVALTQELEWKVDVQTERRICLHFEIDDDRTQIVMLFLAGEIAEQPIIQIASPAADLKDIADKMDQDFMNELLRLNADAPNYGWAIETIEDDGDYLIATSEQILSTLDVNELRMAVLAVAFAADKMEARFGLDNF